MTNSCRPLLHQHPPTQHCPTRETDRDRFIQETSIKAIKPRDMGCGDGGDGSEERHAPSRAECSKLGFATLPDGRCIFIAFRC